MHFAIRPMVPENPISRTIDKALTVFPWHIDAFRLRGLKLVREPASVVLQLAAATEAERLRELVGLTRKFRRSCRDLAQDEAAFCSALQQPR